MTARVTLHAPAPASSAWPWTGGYPRCGAGVLGPCVAPTHVTCPSCLELLAQEVERTLQVEPCRLCGTSRTCTNCLYLLSS